MSVIAIIAVTLAIAIPNYTTIRTSSKRTICINNLKQIDGAVEQWALDYGASQGDVPTSQQEEEIYTYLDNGKPQCPSSGEYTIQPIGTKPQVKCSKEDDGHKL